MKTLSICLTIAAVCLSASSADASGEKLYWTTWTGSAGVWRSNLDGSAQEHIISTPVESLAGVAADAPRNKLYISTGYDLLRSNMDGTGLETVLAGYGAHSYYGVIVDSDAQKVYWSTWDDSGGIRRANLDGSGVETIFVTDTNEYSYHMAIDPTANKLYWANSREIYRSDLDGQNRELLLNPISSRPYSGLDLDVANNKMYFTLLPGDIYRADMDGNNVELLLATMTSDIALDTTTGKMYWAGYGTPASSILRANLDGTDVENLGPANGQSSALTILVPEPATMSMLAVGSLAALRRRKK